MWQRLRGKKGNRELLPLLDDALEGQRGTHSTGISFTFDDDDGDGDGDGHNNDGSPVVAHHQNAHHQNAHNTNPEQPQPQQPPQEPPQEPPQQQQESQEGVAGAQISAQQRGGLSPAALATTSQAQSTAQHKSTSQQPQFDETTSLLTSTPARHPHVSRTVFYPAGPVDSGSEAFHHRHAPPRATMQHDVVVVQDNSGSSPSSTAYALTTPPASVPLSDSEACCMCCCPPAFWIGKGQSSHPTTNADAAPTMMGPLTPEDALDAAQREAALQLAKMAWSWAVSVVVCLGSLGLLCVGVFALSNNLPASLYYAFHQQATTPVASPTFWFVLNLAAIFVVLDFSLLQRAVHHIAHVRYTAWRTRHMSLLARRRKQRRAGGGDGGGGNRGDGSGDVDDGVDGGGDDGGAGDEGMTGHRRHRNATENSSSSNNHNNNNRAWPQSRSLGEGGVGVHGGVRRGRGVQTGMAWAVGALAVTGIAVDIILLADQEDTRWGYVVSLVLRLLFRMAMVVIIPCVIDTMPCEATPQQKQRQLLLSRVRDAVLVLGLLSAHLAMVIDAMAFAVVLMMGTAQPNQDGVGGGDRETGGWVPGSPGFVVLLGTSVLPLAMQSYLCFRALYRLLLRVEAHMRMSPSLPCILACGCCLAPIAPTLEGDDGDGGGDGDGDGGVSDEVIGLSMMWGMAFGAVPPHAQVSSSHRHHHQPLPLQQHQHQQQMLMHAQPPAYAPYGECGYQRSALGGGGGGGGGGGDSTYDHLHRPHQQQQQQQQHWQQHTGEHRVGADGLFVCDDTTMATTGNGGTTMTTVPAAMVMMGDSFHNRMLDDTRTTQHDRTQGAPNDVLGAHSLLASTPPATTTATAARQSGDAGDSSMQQDARGGGGGVGVGDSDRLPAVPVRRSKRHKDNNNNDDDAGGSGSDGDGDDGTGSGGDDDDADPVYMVPVRGKRSGRDGDGDGGGNGVWWAKLSQSADTSHEHEYEVLSPREDNGDDDGDSGDEERVTRYETHDWSSPSSPTRGAAFAPPPPEMVEQGGHVVLSKIGHEEDEDKEHGGSDDGDGDEAVE
ncbi:hypothetical protein PTSG_13076 [Salpingoeca rosetta]|uniref:Uncharacterized protein n=1 Tax=Salpingoeca rosetta (strain ATCC 50818 / BSB-021) TaxID=946362 RepID=F2URX3_SALR5|nr:uncharacterized protein PTSG_13076 [Salpingoeca rosetta]EGD80378.1 hypothetical protein PTSG_13076 [Salpingoeca rosetta]|eukprot:XP_004988168.1 hypothetical protein PTSG_13076 [Salpingoeca rosetta]